jgi:2-dehydro-3-deoxyphosphogluconate aldolase/(4S)-4-hydroxy-2-oxoglutarate aldolase
MTTSPTAEQFVAFFKEVRGSAILRTPNREAVVPAMEAAVAGGFRVVEFTLTTPGALDAIGRFADRAGLAVGAGTVLTKEDAQAAVGAGATFLVSPVVDEAVIEEASRLGVAMMPGTFTPTEMERAHRAGAPLQKLFPGPPGGPAYVKSCLGPLPHLRIVPTNDVGVENAAAYLRAGAWAVGFVAHLFAPEDLDSGRFDRVEVRARALLASLEGAP